MKYNDLTDVFVMFILVGSILMGCQSTKANQTLTEDRCQDLALSIDRYSNMECPHSEHEMVAIGRGFCICKPLTE